MRQAPQTKESRRLEIQEVIMPDPHRRLYILQLESGHYSTDNVYKIRASY